MEGQKRHSVFPQHTHTHFSYSTSSLTNDFCGFLPPREILHLPEEGNAGKHLDPYNSERPWQLLSMVVMGQTEDQKLPTALFVSRSSACLTIASASRGKISLFLGGQKESGNTGRTLFLLLSTPSWDV